LAPNSLSVAHPLPVGSASAKKKIVLTVLRLTFGIAILAYLFESGQIHVGLFRNIAHAWPIMIAGLICLLIDVFLMAMRTSLLFRAMSFHVCLANAMRLTLIGFFFSTFLPGAAGGDLAKVYYATKENQGRRAEVAAVLLFDRIIGLLSLLLLPLIAAPFFSRLVQSVTVLRYLLTVDALLAAALVGGLVVIMTSQRIRRAFSLESSSWLGERNVVRRIVSTIAAFGKAPAAVVNALALSLLANCSLIVVTWLAAMAVQPLRISSKLFLVAPIGHVVNSLPLTPGGLGVGETAFASLFAAAGIRAGAETLLCWRLWNALIGLAGLAIYFLGIGRIVSEAVREISAGESESSAPDLAEANSVKSPLNVQSQL
jgi:glycosyltransferase 2 family protein